MGFWEFETLLDIRDELRKLNGWQPPTLQQRIKKFTVQAFLLLLFIAMFLVTIKILLLFTTEGLVYLIAAPIILFLWYILTGIIIKKLPSDWYHD